MPPKNKLQKCRRLSIALGRESIKKIRDEQIKGDYAWLMFIYLYYCWWLLSKYVVIIVI